MEKGSGPLKRFPGWIVWLFVLWLAIHYWDTAVKILGVALTAAVPLILGLVIAYVVNIIMMALERKLLSGMDASRVKVLKRPLSVLLSFVCLVGVIVALTYIVLPRLWQCLEMLAGQITVAINRLLPYIGQWLPEEVWKQFDIQSSIRSAVEWLVSFAGGALNGVVSGLSFVVSGAATMFIACFFGIYLLMGKEKLLGQLNRLIDTYLPKRVCTGLRYVARVANGSFHRFLVGQCTEAVVLGALCTLGMLILRMPYAAMIGCTVGVTALIPFVGAYLGAAVGAIMILTVSPIKALGFLIYLLILQQVEGNLIYPRVVGSSIGLPGIWVLAAITIGGGFGGIIGMMLGVPIMATVYQLVRHDMAKRNGVPAEQSGDGEDPK